MKKTITTALIILASLTLLAQDCHPPKHIFQVERAILITKKYWGRLTPKEKISIRDIMVYKYEDVDTRCLNNRSAREFLEYLKIYHN